MRFEATYLHHVRIDTTNIDAITADFSLTALNVLGKAVEVFLEEEFETFFGSRRKRDIEKSTFILSEIDLTYMVLSWGQYMDFKSQQIDTLPEGVEIVIPEIFGYLDECGTCSVLPMIEIAPGSAQPSVGDPMMNSLIGSGVDVDLCTAKNKENDDASF